MQRPLPLSTYLALLTSERGVGRVRTTTRRPGVSISWTFCSAFLRHSRRIHRLRSCCSLRTSGAGRPSACPIPTWLPGWLPRGQHSFYDPWQKCNIDSIDLLKSVSLKRLAPVAGLFVDRFDKTRLHRCQITFTFSYYRTNRWQLGTTLAGNKANIRLQSCIYRNNHSYQVLALPPV